jgi:hypothetical protein
MSRIKMALMIYMWLFNKNFNCILLLFILGECFSAFGQQFASATTIGDRLGYRYFISNEEYSFWNARAHVKSLDTSLDLLSIHDVNENYFVYNKVIQEAGHTYCWLGGTDEFQEGNWVWLDGTPWDYEQWETDSTIITGGGPEPNNMGENEHYLMLFYYGNGNWNDATNNTGDQPFHYLFRVKIESPTTDTNITPPFNPTIKTEVYPTLLSKQNPIIYIRTSWTELIEISLFDSVGKLTYYGELKVPGQLNELRLPVLVAGQFHGRLICNEEEYLFKIIVVN